MALLAVPTLVLWSVGMSFLTFGTFFVLWTGAWIWWIRHSRLRWGPIVAVITLAFVVVTPHFGFWASSGCLEARADNALTRQAGDESQDGPAFFAGGRCGLVDYSQLTVRDITPRNSDANDDAVAAVFHDAGPPLFNYGWVERGYVYSPNYVPTDCRPMSLRSGGGGFSVCDVEHLAGSWYVFRIKVTTS